MSIKEQLVKLKVLESRIERWKQVGPACTKTEWDHMNKDLAVIRNFIRALERYPEKNRIHRTHGKMLNGMWHRYATKQGQPLDAFMGGINWVKQAESL